MCPEQNVTYVSGRSRLKMTALQGPGCFKAVLERSLPFALLQGRVPGHYVFAGTRDADRMAAMSSRIYLSTVSLFRSSIEMNWMKRAFCN